MRKFKVKNRRKRKYVRKHDLSSSLSLTNTLTLGALPALLIAIPFIATYVVYNVSFPTLTIPEYTLPEINVHFTLPALPEMSLPKLSLPSAPSIPQVNAPTVPTLTFPDFTQLFISVYHTVTTTLGTFGAAVLFGATTFSANTVQATGHVLTLLDPRPFLAMSGHALSTSVQQAVLTAEAEWSATGELMLVTGNALTVMWNAIVAWLNWFGGAVVNAWNAFVWFIGTPFRALDASTKEMAQASSPVTTFLEDSFRVAANEFASGLNTLTGANAK